jgi:hypothetical protein
MTMSDIDIHHWNVHNIDPHAPTSAIKKHLDSLNTLKMDCFARTRISWHFSMTKIKSNLIKSVFQ